MDTAKAGASSAMAKAKEVEEKYHVTEKVSKGFLGGLNKLADALDPDKKKEIKDGK